MTCYRSYLDRRGTPRGPWVVLPHEQGASDSGSGRNGENPERSGGVEGEAPQSGAEGASPENTNQINSPTKGKTS